MAAVNRTARTRTTISEYATGRRLAAAPGAGHASGMASTQVDIRDNRELRRVEALDDDGEVAGFAEYQISVDGTRSTSPTPRSTSEFEGQGVGSQLAAGVLEFVRGEDAAIVPDVLVHPLLHASKHEDTQDLLADGVDLEQRRADATSGTPMTYDVIVKGGRWFDGTGAPSQLRHLGVRDGRVAAVSEEPLDETGCGRVVDAAGQVGAPRDDRHPHPLRRRGARGPGPRGVGPARRHHDLRRLLLAVDDPRRPGRPPATSSAGSRRSRAGS